MSHTTQLRRDGDPRCESCGAEMPRSARRYVCLRDGCERCGEAQVPDLERTRGDALEGLKLVVRYATPNGDSGGVLTGTVTFVDERGGDRLVFIQPADSFATRSFNPGQLDVLGYHDDDDDEPAVEDGRGGSP